MLTKKGNSKISKKCSIFVLPTAVCGTTCVGCYARKAELRFPKVLEYRNRNYNASLDQINFIDNMITEIKKSGNELFRIHESGDFYSQQYVNSWSFIVGECPDVMFYAYTKKANVFDLSGLASFPNMNIINSITPLGVNYGDEIYCNKLAFEHGYVICPCKKGVKIDCMADCTICLTASRVCFLKH